MNFFDEDDENIFKGKYVERESGVYRHIHSSAAKDLDGKRNILDNILKSFNDDSPDEKEKFQADDVNKKCPLKLITTAVLKEVQDKRFRIASRSHSS